MVSEVDRGSYSLHKLRFKAPGRGSNDTQQGLEPICHVPPSLLARRTSGGRNGEVFRTGLLEGASVLKKIAEERAKLAKEKSAKPVTFRPKTDELEQLQRFAKQMGSPSENHMASVCFRLGLAAFAQLEKEGTL